MNVNTLSRIIAMAGVLILPWSNPAAARSNKIADSLSAISRQMFAERNEYFIVVEALKDGFIRDGENFSFSYADSAITINGRQIPTAAEARYLKLIRAFYANGMSTPAPGSWLMQGDSLSLAGDILDPGSNFRRRGPWHHTNRKPGNQLIIEEMARDGLVDTARPVHIQYTQKALIVNGQMLAPAPAAKYQMLIRLLEGFVPAKESDIYSINR
jgi:hypothetical protein